MMTEPERLFEERRGRTLGRRVSCRRLACDSLLLYLDFEPGDEEGITLWFEPIRHLRGADGVLLGSMQVAAACDSEEAMAAVADGPLDAREAGRLTVAMSRRARKDEVLHVAPR